MVEEDKQRGAGAKEGGARGTGNNRGEENSVETEQMGLETAVHWGRVESGQLGGVERDLRSLRRNLGEWGGVEMTWGEVTGKDGTWENRGSRRKGVSGDKGVQEDVERRELPSISAPGRGAALELCWERGREGR